MMKTHLPTREIAFPEEPGEADALRARLRLYGPVVYGYARRHGMRSAEAVELTAVVLRDIARATGRDVDSEAFGDRLLTLTRRKLNRLPSAREGSPDAVWQSEHFRRVVVEAMGRVEHEFATSTWRAFRRTAVDGRTAAAVGVELAMTVGEVHVARCQVLARLRDEVQTFRADDTVTSNFRPGA